LQSESNGTNTFLFFDDFTGSSLNSSKWEIDAVGTIDETVNNEIILTGGRSSSSTYWIYNTTDTGNQHRAKINGSQFIIPSQCTIEWNGKAISGDMAQTGIGLIKSTDNTVRAYLAISDGSGGNGCAPSLWGFVEGTTGSGTITVGQYKNFRLIKNGSAITGYQKDTSSESWTQMLTGTSSNIDRMAITQGTYGGYTYEQMALDNIKVREYSSAEPTIVVGSQKTLDAEIVYFNSEWFDNPNDINGTELKGLISDKDYKAYLDVNDSVNVVSSDPFIFTLESSEPQFTNTYETSITYTYDSRGRLTSETSDINGSTYSTSYSYDDASNITSITYPSTNSYSYTYDDVNRITALPGYASFAYTATNMIDNISYQNGVTTDYTYDVRDRPTGIVIGSLETLNYTYDPSGNVLKMNDWEYEYDGLNRLEAATSVFDLDYTYDALGNRTQQTENTVTTSYTYNTLMRLTAKTVGSEATYFTYDPNGNMTEKEEGNSSYTYTWDINNRLREVRDDGNLLFEYLYDSHGRRVKSHNHSTGVTTTYIYAGINVIHEVTSSESTDYLYANGMRIAKKTGATVKYFHSDHLGSTRLVTDSSGQPTFESDYKPFGQDANATGTEKYTFTGQYSEADIGLYYFGARWYDASLGRFISEDPIKGSMLSSQSQNPYVYCMNNPLRYVDPSGMMTVDHIEVNGHDVTLIDGHPAEYWSGSGSHGESMFDRVAQEHYDRVSRGEYASGDYYTHGDFGTDSWGVNMVYHTDNTLGNLLGHNFGNDFDNNTGVSTNINARDIIIRPGNQANNDAIVQKSFWERGGTKLVGGLALINGGAALTYAAAAGYTFGAIPSATGIGIPATIGVWAASTGAAYLGANMMVYGLAYTVQGAEELEWIHATQFDNVLLDAPPLTPWWW
jgi:RHS repeat-associated protein